MAEGAESPVVPPRIHRRGSRASQISQASTVTSETQFEPESFARDTPPPSDVADIAKAQAAPLSTPSSEMLDGEYSLV
ncbi:hypothetical protein E2C01_084025 [Portunus trituberculatus]|uniref:Uncharacterized protein n=1 Tax=Portunus trituberculatus TaxID=210409 RepID=A0A5B7J9K5_PORTR|nr:hypothetical protein [Portunus trituberculatus]